ncbi:MAG: prepilin-type N-terminal cleavage/methylation domain-containing protein [Candidatus Riflebacteria bacterium]|nr:prepilin-type N-terminal cleavage/methylation domain-containing protein [Candidatus Riflebacteria bacterium]
MNRFYPGLCIYKSGISLVEVMIALFIFALILAPMFNTFIQSSTIIKIGQHDLEILNLSSSFTSQMRTLDCASLPVPLTDVALTPVTNGGPVKFGSPQVEVLMPSWDANNFNLSVTTKSMTLPGVWLGNPPVAKLCLLRVQWKERIGQAKTLFFPVLLTKEQ